MKMGIKAGYLFVLKGASQYTFAYIAAFVLDIVDEADRRGPVEQFVDRRVQGCLFAVNVLHLADKSGQDHVAGPFESQPERLIVLRAARGRQVEDEIQADGGGLS